MIRKSFTLESDQNILIWRIQLIQRANLSQGVPCSKVRMSYRQYGVLYN
jgi:hypothetical protein